ncbi:uncharacterized protein BYT42DRAFT_551413 [Radiomyces spectabilis]|uniref:uncharacterized protein n=1 Tax=Radiomyces spectabilis TaxID=64574 RepID=UPI00221FC36A|nr:uncharacterized protein BYT42DRAFT_551413 [Radiomyces spectabilis]KAI8393545.1 hypothetical protein BYT42DRAFT_551413 [Radiomyces spectabilis]
MEKSQVWIFPLSFPLFLVSCNFFNFFSNFLLVTLLLSTFLYFSIFCVSSFIIMGCCYSNPLVDKTTVHEVVLDADGVAHRVPKGQGTHLIHVSADNETHMEEKPDGSGPQPDLTYQKPPTTKWPSLSSITKPAPASKRIHPSELGLDEKKPE